MCIRDSDCYLLTLRHRMSCMPCHHDITQRRHNEAKHQQRCREATPRELRIRAGEEEGNTRMMIM
eukprot:30645-Alexandrium_andersonii.AAC.1